MVEKALRIARGFILRGKKDSMAMFVTIGLNATARVEGFILHNHITSAQDFGATIRSAGCRMIAKFGLDGRRLRVVGMEPSTMSFDYVKPLEGKRKKRKGDEVEEDEEDEQ